MKRSSLPVLLALAGCGAVGAGSPPPAPPACDAAGYAEFVGQGEEIFARATFPAPMRIIRPGDAVTRDFRPDRLNFDLDAQGNIIRVWCG